MDENPITYLLPEWAYKLMKWAALIAIPAFGVFYKTLAVTLSWPMGDEVSTICNALAAFLGTVIGVTTYTAKRTKE